MSTLNDFLKNCSKYGWIYVQSLTYKNLTNKFPVDIKGCPSSFSPLSGTLSFLLFAPSTLLPPVPLSGRPLEHCYGNCLWENLALLEKVWFL